MTNKCDRKIFAVTEKKSWGVVISQQSLTYTLKVRENHSELVDGHDNFTRVKILVRTHLTTKMKNFNHFSTSQQFKISFTLLYKQFYHDHLSKVEM